MGRPLSFFSTSATENNTTMTTTLSSLLTQSRYPLQIRARLSKATSLIFSSSPFRSPKDDEASPYPEPPHHSPTPTSPPTPPPTPKSPTPPPSYANLPSLSNPTPTLPNPKYAHQGLSLLHTALTEENIETPLFTRQLYIHSLTYLLQALPPTSLSEAEITGLREALPAPLLQQQSQDPETKSTQSEKKENQSSYLRTVLATTSYILITILAFLSPYISLLLSKIGYLIQRYELHTRAFNALGSVVRGVPHLVVGAIDPASVSWYVAEFVGGFRDGWRKEWRKQMGMEAEGGG